MQPLQLYYRIYYFINIETIGPLHIIVYLSVLNIEVC